MSAPNPPRKHHFLPKFYTREWANEKGEITRFQLIRGGRLEKRNVAPGAVGYVRDLYTIPGEPPTTANRLESEFFSYVDNAAARAMAIMNRGGMPEQADAKSDWARFIMAFNYRSPGNMSAMKDAWERLARTDSYLNELSREQIDALRLHKLPNSVDNRQIGQVIMSMTWSVLGLGSADFRLMTSDCPVILSNGIRPPDGNIAIPISSTNLFVAHWGRPALQQLLQMSPNALVKRANKLIVERAADFVLAVDDRQRPFVEKHFGQAPIPSAVQTILAAYSR